MKQVFTSLIKRLLLFAALLSALPALAQTFESGGLRYEINYGTTTVSVSKPEAVASWPTGELVIPAIVTYEDVTYTVTKIGLSAFDGCDKITSVTIPADVTSIGGSAFGGCSSLTSINLPASVTSIGHFAFSGCSALISVELPEAVAEMGQSVFSNCSKLVSAIIPEGIKEIPLQTFAKCSSLSSIEIPGSVSTIGSWAFQDCSNLTSVNIKQGVSRIEESVFSGCSSLTSVELPSSILFIGGSAFSGCSQLVAINIPEGVTSINNYLFYRCSSLASVEIPNSVTSIEAEAFSQCSSLTFVDIPNSVTSLGEWAFRECENLKSVKLSNNLTNLSSGLFYKCTSLESIDIPNSVTSMGDVVFQNCTSLTSLKIPDSVTSIGGGVIQYCSSLTSIEISNSVTLLGGDFFRDCTKLTSVKLPNKLTEIPGYAFIYCQSLASIEIPESVKSIGDLAFAYCPALTEIRLPNTVTSIGERAFDGCTKLASANIPAGVKSIPNGTFSGCSALKALELPASVTSIGDYAFLSCSSLSDINIPNAVNYIGERAFDGCSKLVSANVPEGVTAIKSRTFAGCNSLVSLSLPSSVTSIGEWAFSGCSMLESIKLPEGITEIEKYTFEGCSSLTSLGIPSSVTSIGENAFSNCSKLASVNLPEGIKAIEVYAFSSCTSLTSIEIPNSVTSIGKGAFEGCNKLASINLPEGIKAIENNTFNWCSSLTSIDIPNSVTSIGEYAFANCNKLASINLPGGLKEIKRGAFESCGELPSVTIPQSVSSLGEYIFRWCNQLRSVIISNPDIAINPETFADCYSNPIIVCPDGLEIPSVDPSQIIRFNGTGATVLADGTILTDNGKTLAVVPSLKSESYTIPDGVTTISSDAFRLNQTLKELTIPAGIEYIEPNAFANISIEKVNFIDWENWYATVKLGNLYSNPYWHSTPYVGGVKMVTPELKEGMTEIPDYINYGLSFKDEVDLPTTIKRIGAYAFYNNTELYSVILPAGLEEIGECAFMGCSLLENPSFPAGLKKIEDGAYKNCTSITEITLPTGLTELGTLTPRDVVEPGMADWMGSASFYNGIFEGCTSLEKAVLVADIDYLDDNIFRGATSLEKVFLPLQLKTIGDYAFYDTALDEITLPATLETIGDYAFSKDYSNFWNREWSSEPAITSLSVPNSVKSIGKSAFEWQRISNLTIGSGIEVIAEGAFANNNLEIINFSEGLTEIGERAFANDEYKASRYGYGMISTVNLPSTLTTIGQYAFWNTAICEMNVPDNVMDLPSGSCGRPSVLTLGSGIKSISSDAFSFDKLYTFRLKAHTPPVVAPDAFPITDAENDQLTLIVNQNRRSYYVTNARWKQIDQIIEEGQSDVVIHMTGESPISEEIRVTTGLMPSSVTKMKVVGPLTPNDLVIIKENMVALTSLDMSEVKGVTGIPEGQFYGSMLTDIVLPDNLESIGSNAFANCGLLQIAKLPGTLKSIGDNAFGGSPRVNITELPAGLETIGYNAFSNTGLTRIVANEALAQIGSGAFYGCDQLEVADFSASAIETIPDNAFANCYELDEVILPETVKEIGGYAFSNTALRNIDFVSGVNFIGGGAFSNNRRLVTATLPKSVTSVEGSLFSNCPRLITVSMPSSTSTVGYQILNDDKKLSNISCAATEAPTAANGAFDGLRMRYVSLIVPTLSYRAYLNAPQWGKFQTIKNLIPVEIDYGVDASIVAEDEYQQMLEEDKLEAEEDAAAQETAPSPQIQTTGSVVPRSMISAMPRAARRAAARAATTQYFASLFDGAQVQTGDENTAMRVFINPKDDVKITSIRFGEEELLSYYEEHNSILLPPGVSDKLVILTDAEPKPVSIELDKSEETVYEGETVQLTATVTGPDSTDKTVAWSSSDEDVATVDKDGLVTGVAAGSATITAKLANGMEATCKITVETNVIAAEGISLNLPEAEMTEGSTMQLIATVDPETTTDKTVTWTSSDESVATVDSEGNVTALQIGTATITARTVNGFEATCQITVVANVIAPESISLNKTEEIIAEEETVQLIATILPEDATEHTVTWSSSDESVAIVDETGLVKGVKAGTATITATSSNGLTATCAVVVEAKPSAIEGVEGDGQVSVRVENGEIVVEAPDDAEVDVFAITGALIRHTRDHRIAGLTRGVYIVRVAGKSIKVSL